MSCHALSREGDFLAAYEQGDPGDFTSRFATIDRAQCLSCHRPEAAGARCTQCHLYHVEGPRSTVLGDFAAMVDAEKE